MRRVSDCEITTEYWDLCDSCGNLLGEKIRRGESHPEGTYHIVVCVWIWNRQGKVLLTLRSMNKKQFPGLWEGMGGSVQAGETSMEGVRREVQEEIGITCRPEELQLVTRLLEKTALVDIYALRLDIPAEELILQEEEVDCAKWFTVEELETFIKEDKFSAAALRRWRAAEKKMDSYRTGY